MKHKRLLRQHAKRNSKRIDVYEFANQLRHNMTLAESVLWQVLQQHFYNQFKTQVVVGGRFIADFICWRTRLIVEVDGSIHRLTSVRRKDKYRTKVLTKLGYTVIRFTNNQVIHSIDKVIRTIEKELLLER